MTTDTTLTAEQIAFAAKLAERTAARKAAKAAKPARKTAAEKRAEAARADYDRTVAANPTVILYNPDDKAFDAHENGLLVASGCETYMAAEAARDAYRYEALRRAHAASPAEVAELDAEGAAEVAAVLLAAEPADAVIVTVDGLAAAHLSPEAAASLAEEAELVAAEAVERAAIWGAPALTPAEAADVDALAAHVARELEATGLDDLECEACMLRGWWATCDEWGDVDGYELCASCGVANVAMAAARQAVATDPVAARARYGDLMAMSDARLHADYTLMLELLTLEVVLDVETDPAATTRSEAANDAPGDEVPEFCPRAGHAGAWADDCGFCADEALPFTPGPAEADEARALLLELEARDGADDPVLARTQDLAEAAVAAFRDWLRETFEQTAEANAARDRVLAAMDAYAHAAYGGRMPGERLVIDELPRLAA